MAYARDLFSDALIKGACLLFFLSSSLCVSFFWGMGGA